MYENFTFAELEQMKQDLLDELVEARSVNDWDWEQSLNEKLNALFDAELDVMPDGDDPDEYWANSGPKAEFTEQDIEAWREEQERTEDAELEEYWNRWRAGQEAAYEVARELGWLNEEAETYDSALISGYC